MILTLKVELEPVPGRAKKSKNKPKLDGFPALKELKV